MQELITLAGVIIIMRKTWSELHGMFEFSKFCYQYLMSHVKELGKKQTIPIIQRNCIRTQYQTQHFNVPFKRSLSQPRIPLCPTVVTNTFTFEYTTGLHFIFWQMLSSLWSFLSYNSLCFYCVCVHFHMCAHRQVCTTRRPEDSLGVIPQALLIFIF